MTISKKLSNTIVDAKAFQKGDAVDEAFASLRRDSPFEVATPDGYDPFWVATRHAEIVEIERQPDVFHAGDRANTVRPAAEVLQTMAMTGGDPNWVHALVALDGDVHKAMRAILFPHVTPKALKTMREGLGDVSRQFVDQMLAKAPECDFATEIAFLYPLRVIMQLLRIPIEDEPFMLSVTQQLFSSEDPELNLTRSEVSAAQQRDVLMRINAEFEAYFDKVTLDRRANPDSSLCSLIANATYQGEYLSRKLLMGYYMIAATAGHDTTANTLSGGMWALAKDPALLPQLQRNPELIDAFIEESIRWTVPVKHFMRSAAVDTELAGRKVSKGDWIMLSFHSAARDEAVYEEPHAFRLDRPMNRQIAFGFGSHVCLGQHLARMEMKLFWEELLPRIKAVSLAGEPERTRSNFVCGPKHVPIRFELA
jgi:cytochrome P450